MAHPAAAEVSQFFRFCATYYSPSGAGAQQWRKLNERSADERLRRVVSAISSTTLTFAATSVTVGVYGLTQLLTRIVPPTSVVARTPAPIVSEESARPPNIRRRLSGRVLALTVLIYENSLYHRWIHHDGASRCRFIPSCTEYAVRAVDKYGLIRGLELIAKRFHRCGPRYRGDLVDFP